MDKARLEELKQWVKQMQKFGVSEGNDLTALIDAAVTEPTDEAVQRAIAYITAVQSCAGSPEVFDMYDTVLACMQQMRSEPCEWCVDKHSYSLRYGLGGDTHKHCANCGRPLKGGE